jgi:WD40 repeat protein
MFGLSKSAKSQPELAHRWHGRVDDHVIALAWSPDGRVLAAAAVSGPIALYGATDGVLLRTLPGHGFGTSALSWHPESRLLASGGQDGNLKIWDAATGALQFSLPGGAPWVERVAWNQDGDLLATAAGKKLRLWHQNGRMVRDYAEHASTIADIAWSPKGDQLASACYGCIALWEPDQAKAVRRFEWKGSQLVLAWSPDAKHLATGDQDATVHFWIVKSGQDLQMSGYPTKVRELAWDHTGRYLATGGGATPCVWDCGGKGPAGRTPYQLEGHTKLVSALQYQHGGPLLASGAADGRLMIWHPDKLKKPVAQVRIDSGLSQLAWSPDDRLIALGTESGRVAAYAAPASKR